MLTVENASVWRHEDPDGDVVELEPDGTGWFLLSILLPHDGVVCVMVSIADLEEMLKFAHAHS